MAIKELPTSTEKQKNQLVNPYQGQMLKLSGCNVLRKLRLT